MLARRVCLVAREHQVDLDDAAAGRVGRGGDARHERGREGPDGREGETHAAGLVFFR